MVLLRKKKTFEHLVHKTYPIPQTQHLRLLAHAPQIVISQKHYIQRHVLHSTEFIKQTLNCAKYNPLRKQIANTLCEHKGRVEVRRGTFVCQNACREECACAHGRRGLSRGAARGKSHENLVSRGVNQARGGTRCHSLLLI